MAQRRTFTAKFKTPVVLALVSGALSWSAWWAGSRWNWTSQKSLGSVELSLEQKWAVIAIVAQWQKWEPHGKMATPSG
jgi:hypothetical protein